jgi:hypothetical protein
MTQHLYTKGDAQRLPAAPAATSSEPTAAQAQLPNVQPAAAYQKGTPQRSFSLWFVLSGGEKREKNFFKELMDGPFISSLRVKYLSAKRQGLQPYQMQAQWEQIQKDQRLSIGGQDYALAAFDRVYLLTDVDEFYSQLVAILAHPAPENVHWVVSNPCFEIWLYYCYRNRPEVDLASIQALPPARLSKALKQALHELIPGGVDSARAFEHLPTGIEHGRQHYAEDAQGIPVQFATQMHQMAADMLAQMELHQQEYTALLQQKAARRLEWGGHTEPNNGRR